MEKGPEYSTRNPMDALYADEMAKAIPRNAIRPKSTIQAASTQRVLDMSLDELAKYRLREMPENWKANPNAKNLDEAVGARNFDAKQVVVMESLRRGEKNTLGDFKNSGLSSVSIERKEKGIQAFTYSKPADLSTTELTRVKELKALETVDQKIEKKKSILEKASCAFKSLFTREKHICEIGLGNTCKLCGEVAKRD